MSLAVASIFISVTLVSLVSLLGVLFLTLHESFIAKIMLYFVSFSTGAILGTVFLHLLPEVMEKSGNPIIGSVLILVGMMFAFCIEKFVHWHHCHRTEHDDEHGHHMHPLGSLILVGDSIHNFVDGALIAAAYLVSIPVGIAATIAIVLHEIPQELGHVPLLLHSGFSRKGAISWNILTACTAILGAALALLFEAHVAKAELVLLPIAAGNFLYIAMTDLIPELHKETQLKKSLLQVLLLTAGIALMAALAYWAGDSKTDAAIQAHAQTASTGTVIPTVDGSVMVRVRMP